MTIDPTKDDIGAAVIYAPPHPGPGFAREQGTITSFNEHYVFVRFGLGSTSQAVMREHLEWLATKVSP